jgi:hypothetical protein
MPKGLTPEQEVAWKQERQSQIQDKREAVARQKEIGKQGRSVEEKLHDQALVLEALQKLDKYKPGKVDVKPTLMEEPISRLKPILRARQAARMTTSEGNLSKKVVEDFEMQYGADARKSLMDALSKGWDPGEQGTLAKPYDFVQVGAEDNGALARLRTEILSKNNPTWNAPEKQVDNYSGRTFYQDQTDAYALRGTTSVYGTDRFVNLGKDAYAPVKSPGMGEANAATRSQDGRGDHMATANGLGRQAADDNKVLLLDLRNFEHPDPQKALSQSSLRMMRSALKGFEQQVLSMQRGSDDMSQGFRVAILAPENVALKDDIKLDLRNFREETAAMKKGIKPKTEGEESQVWHEFTIFPTVKLKAEPESDANSSVDLGSAHMPKTS